MVLRRCVYDPNITHHTQTQKERKRHVHTTIYTTLLSTPPPLPPPTLLSLTCVTSCPLISCVHTSSGVSLSATSVAANAAAPCVSRTYNRDSGSIVPRMERWASERPAEVGWGPCEGRGCVCVITYLFTICVCERECVYVCARERDERDTFPPAHTHTLSLSFPSIHPFPPHLPPSLPISLLQYSNHSLIVSQHHTIHIIIVFISPSHTCQCCSKCVTLNNSATSVKFDPQYAKAKKYTPVAYRRGNTAPL